MRKVVILAAGPGKRLLPLTDRAPKALLQLGPETLLEYQVRVLVQLGLPARDIIIVTGHLHDAVENVAADLRCDTIFNPRYLDTNNIVTLFCLMEWAAKQGELLTEIIVVNSDTLAHWDIFKRLLQSPVDNAAVVDKSRSNVEEAMKVEIEGGVIVEFGKSLPGERSHGEYIGLAKFSNQGLRVLFSALQDMVQNGQVNEWYEGAFSKIARDIPIHPVFTQGLPWIEIDTPEDYQRAQLIYRDIIQ